MENSNQKDWQPLESNPAIINKFITDLGFDTQKYIFHELLSIDEWGQAMIPYPTTGIMFLYPRNETQIKSKALEIERIQEEGQELSPNVILTLKRP